MEDALPEDEPEKESLPIEDETTSLDEDENKESIELIGKEDLVPAVEEKEIKTEIESKMGKEIAADEPDSEVFSSEEIATLEDITKLKKQEKYFQQKRKVMCRRLLL